jgi:hypothetical protein
VAENLKHQGMYTLGCSVFKKITPNIELEEINEKNDIMTNGDSYIMNDLNEIQYNHVRWAIFIVVVVNKPLDNN